MGSTVSNMSISNTKLRTAALEIIKEAEGFGYDVCCSKKFNSPDNVIEAADDAINRAQELIIAQDRLNKLNWDVAVYNTYHESTGQPSAIDDKVKKLTEELRRVKCVIDHQLQIENYLQSKSCDSSIPIHAKYHQAVLDLICTMPKTMVELKSNLECLKWLLTFSPGENLNELCSSVTRLYSELQNSATSLEEYQSAIVSFRASRNCPKSK